MQKSRRAMSTLLASSLLSCSRQPSQPATQSCLKTLSTCPRSPRTDNSKPTTSAGAATGRCSRPNVGKIHAHMPHRQLAQNVRPMSRLSHNTTNTETTRHLRLVLACTRRWIVQASTHSSFPHVEEKCLRMSDPRTHPEQANRTGRRQGHVQAQANVSRPAAASRMPAALEKAHQQLPSLGPQLRKPASLVVGQMTPRRRTPPHNLDLIVAQCIPGAAPDCQHSPGAQRRRTISRTPKPSRVSAPRHLAQSIPARSGSRV